MQHWPGSLWALPDHCNLPSPRKKSINSADASCQCTSFSAVWLAAPSSLASQWKKMISQVSEEQGITVQGVPLYDGHSGLQKRCQQCMASGVHSTAGRGSTGEMNSVARIRGVWARFARAQSVSHGWVGGGWSLCYPQGPGKAALGTLPSVYTLCHQQTGAAGSSALVAGRAGANSKRL